MQIMADRTVRAVIADQGILERAAGLVSSHALSTKFNLVGLFFLH